MLVYNDVLFIVRRNVTTTRGQQGERMRTGLPTRFSHEGRDKERQPVKRQRPPVESPTLVATHVGAHGYCDTCGYDFDLTEKDRPIEYRSKQRYEIPCPQCGKTVSCDARFVAHEEPKVGRPRMLDRGSPAPFVPKHIPSHIGAHGYCGRCGQTFVLGDHDKPHKIVVDGNDVSGRVIFLVKCPYSGCESMDDAHAEVLLKRKRPKEH